MDCRSLRAGDLARRREKEERAQGETRGEGREEKEEERVVISAFRDAAEQVTRSPALQLSIASPYTRAEAVVGEKEGWEMKTSLDEGVGEWGWEKGWVGQAGVESALAVTAVISTKLEGVLRGRRGTSLHRSPRVARLHLLFDYAPGSLFRPLTPSQHPPEYV
jgi:hypothetical protein